MTDKFCPRLTHDIKNPVSCQEHACEFWTHIIGKDDQTGAMVDQWACADIIAIRLIVNLSKKTIETTASVDRMNNDIIAMASDDAIKRLIEVKTKKRDITLPALEKQVGGP